MLVLAVIGCGSGSTGAPDAMPIDATAPPDAIALSVYEAYGAAWGEADEVIRDRLLEHSAVDALVVVEPSRELSSRQAVSDAIEQFLAEYPGGSIPLGGNTREAHARAWLTWDVLDGNGATLVSGTDLMALAGDGRIERIHSFFGVLPPPGSPDAIQQAWVDAWNEPDPTARLAALDLSVADDVRFALEDDAPVNGRAALSDYIGAALAALPGRVSEPTSGYLTVPGAWHVAWRDVAADGTTVVGSGVLFVRLAGDGRISDAIAFHGAVP